MLCGVGHVHSMSLCNSCGQEDPKLAYAAYMSLCVCMCVCTHRNIFPIWALGLYRRGVLLGEEIK